MANHGKNTVVKIDNAAGTPVDLSAYIDQSTLPGEVKTADVTTYGMNSEAYIGGLMSNKFSCGGPWDPVLEAHMAGLLGSAGTKTVERGIQGTTAGQRKELAEAILVSYEPDSGHDDAVRWKAEFQITGDVTRTTY